MLRREGLPNVERRCSECGLINTATYKGKPLTFKKPMINSLLALKS